jgi:sulfite exporter TauE/SafE
MPVLELLTSSGLGSLLGMRHALEPDHLAAVTTLVTDHRHRDRRISAAFLGLCWGLGHTFALIVAGAVLVALRTEMPASAANLFELGVAVMLIALGLRAIYSASRQGPTGPVHVHHHGRVVHTHPGAPAHIHIGAWTLARRPLLVGAMHGLAGSGALTALVLATLPSTAARLLYMLLFGIGSTLGMAAMSGLLGWPLGRAGNHHHRVARGISFAVGCLSTAIGVAYGSRVLGIRN